jgi:hypothetical protein
MVLEKFVPFPQGDALSPLLFNFTLQDAFRKVQENKFGLELNETHQLLVYADGVNLFGNNVNTVRRKHNLQPKLIRKLVWKTEKTKYILKSYYQNAWKNYKINIANTSFEDMI